MGKAKPKLLTYSLLFSAWLTFSIITVAYAQGGVDISETPQRLANALGIPLIGGQMLAVLILSCLTLFPTFMLTRKKENATIATIFVGLGTWGFCLAIGWLPLWFMVIVILLVVALYAPKITNMVAGRSD